MPKLPNKISGVPAARPSPPIGANRLFQLVGGDRGRAALHHDETAGIVRQARASSAVPPAASARVMVAITVSPAPVTSAI